MDVSILRPISTKDAGYQPRPITLYATASGSHWHMDRYCSTVPTWHLFDDYVWPNTQLVTRDQLEQINPNHRCSRCFRIPRS